MNYITESMLLPKPSKLGVEPSHGWGVAKERHDIRLQHVVDECRRQGVAVKSLTRAELDRMAGNNGHQGVVAVTSAKQYIELDDCSRCQARGTFVAGGARWYEDPHNLGAILRTADAAGADGVVIPERRAAGVTPTVTKASAGASEHLPIAKVTNIARTVDELKKRTFGSLASMNAAHRTTIRLTTTWIAQLSSEAKAKESTIWSRGNAIIWFRFQC